MVFGGNNCKYITSLISLMVMVRTNVVWLFDFLIIFSFGAFENKKHIGFSILNM
jgi:hypothetical protein